MSYLVGAQILSKIPLQRSFKLFIWNITNMIMTFHMLIECTLIFNWNEAHQNYFLNSVLTFRLQYFFILSQPLTLTPFLQNVNFYTSAISTHKFSFSEKLNCFPINKVMRITLLNIEIFACKRVVHCQSTLVC